MSIVSKYDILPPEAWHYFQQNPIEFIEMMILNPQSKKLGINLFLSQQQKDILNGLARSSKLTAVGGRGFG